MANGKRSQLTPINAIVILRHQFNNKRRIKSKPIADIPFRRDQTAAVGLAPVVINDGIWISDKGETSFLGNRHACAWKDNKPALNRASVLKLGMIRRAVERTRAQQVAVVMMGVKRPVQIEGLFGAGQKETS